MARIYKWCHKHKTYKCNCYCNKELQPTEVSRILDYVQNKDEEMARHNEGKPQMSFLGDFKEAIEEFAKVCEMGANKYGRNNWKKGGRKNVIIDSLGRHFIKLASGTEFDDESGLEHAAHIAWNALAYIQLKKEGKLK